MKIILLAGLQIQLDEQDKIKQEIIAAASSKIITVTNFEIVCRFTFNKKLHLANSSKNAV